jgi:beta-lactamase regulating signal transducer with metallopeptidase domain
MSQKQTDVEVYVDRTVVAELLTPEERKAYAGSKRSLFKAAMRGDIDTKVVDYAVKIRRKLYKRSDDDTRIEYTKKLPKVR